MAHDVFISYSSKDKPVADAVTASLEARGVRCWIAPRDILPGRDWGEAIVQGIQESRVMVLVFSKHANASPQVGREVERAVNKGVIIVPFRIEEVTPSKSLEYFLGTPHWLDALTRPLERHLVYLGDTVARLLSDEASDPSKPQPKLAPRFSPLQIGAALVAIAAVVVALAFWLSRDDGNAVASEIVGEWELLAIPGGPSEWKIEFKKDGDYEGEVVFEDAGTIVDYHSDDSSLPLAKTTGSTQQLGLMPDDGGQLRIMLYTPSEDPGVVKSVSGVLPMEMLGFSTLGKAPTGVGIMYSTDWQRVSDTQWKLKGTLGDLEWSISLTAKDGRYTFKASHDEEGTFEAEDGELRTISEGGLIVDGQYDITRGGDLTLSGAAGNGLWKRAR